jgi:hypothetical protein
MSKLSQSQLTLAALALTFTLAPRILSAQSPTNAAAPDWCIRGATVEMDFEHNRYYGASLDDITNSTVRLNPKTKYATQEYAVTRSGLLKRFEPGQLRLTDLGLLIETAQRNHILWSRDLTKEVWIKANMKAEPAPSSADGTRDGGTRLTATEGNATVVQTIATDMPEEGLAPGTTSSCIHYGFYIRRVSGSGPVWIMSGKPGGNKMEVTKLLSATGYTQLGVYGWNSITLGIQLGTAGDVVDVDMVNSETEGRSNCVNCSSPIPTSDTPLMRKNDYVTVKPESNLYKALAGKAGTVYVKTFNLLGDNAGLFKFLGSGRMLSVVQGNSPNGPVLLGFNDGKSAVHTRLSPRKWDNYAWKTVGDALSPCYGKPVNMLQLGRTVRTVATWGNGHASIVGNNGPVGTGEMKEAVADGVLTLGMCTIMGWGEGGAAVDSTYQCDGYIQDIAFIPGVAAGFGAKLTVDPDEPASGTPPKLPMPEARYIPTRFQDSLTVPLLIETSGAQIYYTLDGSAPDKTKTRYDKPFTLTQTTTVKARAYKAGCEPSDVFEATFTKTQPGATPAK